MRGALARTLAVFLFAALIPTAHAQPPGHVVYCSRECLPAQVNDADATNLPVNVVLYAHIFDELQRAPLNAAPPDPAHEKDINKGFLTPTVKVREELVYFDNNWFTMYLLPRFVDYGPDAPNQDGPLGYPLKLAGKQAKLYWYLSAHFVPEGNSTTSPAGSVGAMPRLTVYARIDSGRHPMHGTLIAEGSTSTAALVGVPGSDYAYEFEIPLDIKISEVPPGEGFVVSVNWYQYQDGEEQVTQGDWRIRSGPRFAPRLILPIENPMKVTEVESLYRSGTHYLITSITPVLGAYDINPFSLNMTYDFGPTVIGNPAPVFYFFNPREPSTVRVVWSVPGEPKDFKAGTYGFNLKVSNLVGTYEHHEKVNLDIIQFLTAKKRPFGAKSPGLEAPAILLAVLGLAWAARRRDITDE